MISIVEAVPLQPEWSPPVITMPPNNVTAELGDNVTLTCAAKGNPKPKIRYWTLTPNILATYIGETGRNLNKGLTEHNRVTRNGDLNNNIAEHHFQTNRRIDWDSAECIIYSTDYYQQLTQESWFTNLEQTPLNQCQQLPAPYKRLISDTKTDKQ